MALKTSRNSNASNRAPLNPERIDSLSTARRWLARSLISAALAAITLAAFWQVTSFGLIDLDDPYYITRSPHVSAGLTWDGMWWALTHTHLANWHPLTTWSYMLDVQIFGVNPPAMHGVNLAIHTLNTVLLFFILDHVTGFRWRSAFVAGIFAVHPLRVESVAWIAERKDVLSGLLGLITIAAYAWYSRRPGAARYALVAGAFVLGLMSKPMLVTLPVVLLLLDVWPLRRWRIERDETAVRLATCGWPVRPIRRLVLEKIPLLALAAGSSVVTVVAQSSFGAAASVERYPLASRLGNSAVAYFRYLEKFFWPVDLAVLYPPLPARAAIVLLAWAALIAICVLAIFAARNRPYLFTGWFWYLGTLVPVIGLVQVGEQSIADRYTYFPMIGLTLAITWIVAERWRQWRFPRAALGAVAVAVVVLCAVRTRSQAAYWRDSESLFARTLEVAPENPAILNLMGSTLSMQGRYDEAVEHFRRSLQLDPERHEAWANLGLSLLARNQQDEALRHLHRAVELAPHSAEMQYALATGHYSAGQLELAEDHADRALHLDPAHLPSHYLLGLLRTRQGRLEEAEQHLQRATQLPDQVDARYQLAIVQMRQGRVSQAVENLKSISDAPSHGRAAQLALAEIALRRGNRPEADAWLRRVIASNPGDAQTHFQVAVISHAAGDIDTAISHYRRALELNPVSAARNNLAWILATSPNARWRDGSKAIELAMALPADVPAALDTLAAAYAEAGRFGDAIETAQRAVALAEGAGNPDLAGEIRRRLELYQAGKPYRDTSAPAPAPSPSARGPGGGTLPTEASRSTSN